MRLTRHRHILVLLALLAWATPGCIPLGGIDYGAILTAEDGPDGPTVVAGLKEALVLGSDRAVAGLSRPDGFLGDALLRIALPESFQGAASALRSAGLGGAVDELETALNRAAEQAAGQAAPVFHEAIRSLSIADGFAILNGHETAATDLFRQRTGEALRARFEPIVAAQVEATGLGRSYRQAVDAYSVLRFGGAPEPLDLGSYVTEKALDGLFLRLADEEQAIRRNPAARTTALLRQVFGSLATENGGRP
jgi:hypothetical protein